MPLCNDADALEITAIPGGFSAPESAFRLPCGVACLCLVPGVLLVLVGLPYAVSHHPGDHQLAQFYRNIGAFRQVALTGLLAVGITAAWLQPAAAAQGGGVTLPPRLTVGTTNLVLNGFGVRTYSILAIHIYVAGLYLERPDHDAGTILASPGIKVLWIRFVHDVGVTDIRDAWKKGLLNNCAAPCRLSPAVLSRFLAALQPVRAGDLVTFVFETGGLNVYDNGRLLGRITNTYFTRLMLAVFIGPHVAAPQLRRELLGLQ